LIVEMTLPSRPAIQRFVRHKKIRPSVSEGRIMTNEGTQDKMQIVERLQINET